MRNSVKILLLACTALVNFNASAASNAPIVDPAGDRFGQVRIEIRNGIIGNTHAALNVTVGGGFGGDNALPLGEFPAELPAKAAFVVKALDLALQGAGGADAVRNVGDIAAAIRTLGTIPTVAAAAAADGTATASAVAAVEYIGGACALLDRAIATVTRVDAPAADALDLNARIAGLVAAGDAAIEAAPEEMTGQRDARQAVLAASSEALDRALHPDAMFGAAAAADAAAPAFPGADTAERIGVLAADRDAAKTAAENAAEPLNDRLAAIDAAAQVALAIARPAVFAGNPDAADDRVNEVIAALNEARADVAAKVADLATANATLVAIDTAAIAALPPADPAVDASAANAQDHVTHVITALVAAKQAAATAEAVRETAATELTAVRTPLVDATGALNPATIAYIPIGAEPTLVARVQNLVDNRDAAIQQLDAVTLALRQQLQAPETGWVNWTLGGIRAAGEVAGFVPPPSPAELVAKLVRKHADVVAAAPDQAAIDAAVAQAKAELAAQIRGAIGDVPAGGNAVSLPARIRAALSLLPAAPEA